MNRPEWPELTLTKWTGTYDLLHLLSQIIGKIKLQFVPYKNHWWNVALYPSVTGLSSGIIPYNEECFEVELDLYSHKIIFRFNSGKTDFIKLQSGSVKSYYKEIKEKLISLGCEINIWPVPVEMEHRIPFHKDEGYREYDPEYAAKFRQIILSVNRVMENFRTGFTGKASPVHFFWGSFDMALTFFSGRPAPEHSGAPNVGRDVMAKAYNAELASFGFWPGKGLGEPAFYAYTYPEPEEYKNCKINPDTAYYHKDMREFILPYDAIRSIKNPDNKILGFFKSSFKAAEITGNWDKELSGYSGE